MRFYFKILFSAMVISGLASCESECIDHKSRVQFHNNSYYTLDVDILVNGVRKYSQVFHPDDCREYRMWPGEIQIRSRRRSVFSPSDEQIIFYTEACEYKEVTAIDSYGHSLVLNSTY